SGVWIVSMRPHRRSSTRHQDWLPLHSATKRFRKSKIASKECHHFILMHWNWETTGDVTVHRSGTITRLPFRAFMLYGVL
ncbi:hypothetical protein GCK32_018232, partial [Trichostrongylus colubriformis]